MNDDVNIAELFHENTNIYPVQVGLDDESPLDRADEFARIRLPQVEMINTCGLEEAIMRRRSQRSFVEFARLSPRALSRLLRFSCSYTEQAPSHDEPGSGLSRAMPSAGAVYPVDVYTIFFRVSGLPAGVYRYAAEDHSLELVRSGEFSGRLSALMLHQTFIADACVVFMLVGRKDRIAEHYGERGYRYLLMEAGHIAQNLCLVATGMGLGSVTIGGFVDSGVNRLLNVDEATQISLYGVAVGVPANPEAAGPG
jgi:SagB-type dehydrogenase family enzyme